MITIYQHIYPVMDFAVRAEKQRERIRAAFRGSGYPLQLVSVQGQVEHVTLERMQWDAWQGGSEHYAYVHLKGITHPGDPCVADWCELLEYFMIDGWRQCRQALEEADVVGVDHHLEPQEHFSGNFFWIRPNALKALPALDRGAHPEGWLATSRKPLIWKSLHDSPVNHYQERYPPERYR